MSLLSNRVGKERTIPRRTVSLSLALLAINGFSISPGATPIVQSDNTIEVRLAPGSGNEWCVYNGQLSADSLARIGDVSIAGVRNVTGEGVVLIHWDRDGYRVGPVSLGLDARSDTFNEMSVAGVWEAHVSGSEIDAPQRVTLEVEFRNA